MFKKLGAKVFERTVVFSGKILVYSYFLAYGDIKWIAGYLMVKEFIEATGIGEKTLNNIIDGFWKVLEDTAEFMGKWIHNNDKAILKEAQKMLKDGVEPKKVGYYIVSKMSAEYFGNHYLEIEEMIKPYCIGA